MKKDNHFSPYRWLSFFYISCCYFMYGHIENIVFIPALILSSLSFFSIKIPRLALSLIMFSLIFFTFRMYQWQLSPDSAVSIFLIIGICKLQETQNKRDFNISLYCFYFLLAGCALYNTSLFFISFSVIACMLSISFFGIKNIYIENMAHIIQKIKDTGFMAILALPVIALLFLFFPRFNAFFPSIGSKNLGKIGYSNEVNNDQISSLSLSSEIMFRAKVSKEIPTHQLYWRGSVLENTNGYNWKKRKAQISPCRCPFLGVIYSGNLVRYASFVN